MRVRLLVVPLFVDPTAHAAAGDVAVMPPNPEATLLPPGFGVGTTVQDPPWKLSIRVEVSSLAGLVTRPAAHTDPPLAAAAYRSFSPAPTLGVAPTWPDVKARVRCGLWSSSRTPTASDAAAA
jgi:hypothetical protein